MMASIKEQKAKKQRKRSEQRRKKREGEHLRFGKDSFINVNKDNKTFITA